MVITVSQILIFICVIFFIFFNLISIYLYQENYNYKKIEIKSSSLAWEILSELDIYKEWWSKFQAIDHVNNYVQVEETQENLFFKIVIKNVSKSIIEEHWSFIIRKTDNISTLLIRKETITNSQLLNFMNKYWTNSADIKQFINNFKKEQEYLLQNKN